MAGDDDDDSQKTEEPTHKRLEDAREKGNVPISREVNNFVILSLLTVVFVAWVPYAMRYSSGHLSDFISAPDLMAVNGEVLPQLLVRILKLMASVLLMPMIALSAVVIVVSILQNGFRIVPSLIAPKFSRISLFEGAKRMFSSRALMELLKGLLKIGLVGTVAIIAIYPLYPQLKSLPSAAVGGMLAILFQLVKRMLIGAAIVIAVLTIMDLLYERFRYLKSLRMSRHDIREEYKNTEGNPEVKAKLRDIRTKRARNRMMQAVPTADVVITNPTHFSVALKYDMANMPAPKVVAKGADLVALKIREIAKENDVAIVENPPLARALFASVEIDEDIPLEHYQAVADVIRYVYALKGKLPKKSG